MKQLPTVQHKNNFQDLQVFADPNINKLCDQLSQFVLENLKEELLVVGSIAKLFEGQLPEDYRPKDVDLVLSKSAFRKFYSVFKRFENIRMVEKCPERIILYTPSLAIEIWEFASENVDREKKYYKNLIPYLKYAN